MPRQEVFDLHPIGWENDPEEERFKVSTLDYLTGLTYCNFAIFFPMDEADKMQAVEVLKEGLEKTLAQARILCGTIEKDCHGGHSFVKKKDSTVRFIVQWLDEPRAEESYPSFDNIAEQNFCSTALGNLNDWIIPPMTYGDKPESHPDLSPVVAAYKANFVRGGLVFIMAHHHYANDVMGWAGLTHQLSENCYAIVNSTSFPPWQASWLDVSRLTKPEVPEEFKIDGPPMPERHPDHITAEMLLFHLPKSKAAELKKLASPPDGSRISTYDAFSAYVWRTLTRLRAPVFKADLSAPLFWSEAVDMRRRMHSPKVHPRVQQNVMSAALSDRVPVTAPTAAEVISEWPLWKLAFYIRQMTNSITQEALDESLSAISKIRDKTALNIRITSYPPMSILQTDHRSVNITGTNFGFARPVIYRVLLDSITQGVNIIYPPRASSSGTDEGPEISISYEKSLKQVLINDPEWKGFFEYRGVDAIDAEDH
jgi:hypothetical protein